MKTYFIRHTEKLDIDDKTFNNLLEKNLVAIHFPSLKESFNEESDTRSLNPEDYEYKAGKEAVNSFLTLANEGGYVCAEYRSLQGALIGKVSQNTPIQLLEGTWGDKNNLQGRKAILKTLPLQNAKRISPPEYLVISSGRPRQGTIKNWRNIGKRIEALVENNRLDPILPNLSPTQQEVLCSEFLRSEVNETNLLPKIESLLLPVGRTLLDIDIIGINSESKKIYAQVTYSELKRSKLKFDNLKKYKSENTIAILFCNCSEPKIIDNIIVYPLQIVFDTYCKSDIGEKWLNIIFNRSV